MTSTAKPDPSPAISDELVVSVKQAVSRLFARFRQERPVGDLGDVALEVLARIEKHGASTLTALSEHHRVTPASMSQTVNRLTSAGYAVRVPDPGDGRRVLLQATPEGAELSVAARTSRDAWLASHLAALTDEERDTVARACVLLRAMAES